MELLFDGYSFDFRISNRFRDFLYNIVLIVSIVVLIVIVQSVARVQLFATHRLYPARFLCPRDFPGKNIGVGCYFLLQRKRRDS